MTLPTLDSQAAEQLIAAGTAHARTLGVQVRITVVGSDGSLLATNHPQGNAPETFELSWFKAYAAAMPTGAPELLSTWQKREPGLFAEISRYSMDPLLGGDGRAEIRRGGVLRGGIGASGAPSEVDQLICEYALELLGYDPPVSGGPGLSGNPHQGVHLADAVPWHLLNDGQKVPAIGLGTAPMGHEQTETAVARALRLGYRLFDTGSAYGNESAVGQAIAAGSVPREEIRVLTKLRGRAHGYEQTIAAFEESRRKLGLRYVDLFLIHWPLPALDKYVESWRAMIKLRDDGVVRSIGVSNFTAEHLARLVKETGVTPTVNQVEMHPGFPQPRLRAVHEDLGVRTMSYSPLGRGTDLLGAPEVASVARAHGVTPAQAVLRWHVQLGAIPLPRSGDPRRQRENLDVLGFELAPDELDRISLMAGSRIGFDPETHAEY